MKWNIGLICEFMSHLIQSDIKSARNFFSVLFHEIGHLIEKKTKAKQICVFATWNIFVALLISIWSWETKSLSLTALVQLVFFDILYLLVAMIQLWLDGRPTDPQNTFAYSRYEVVAAFTATMLTIFSALFIFKESTERFFENTEVLNNYQLLAGVLTLFTHIITIYSVENRSMAHVVQASSSSWLQEQVSDICDTICWIFPGLSRFLLPRINPILLVGTVSTAAVIIGHFVPLGSAGLDLTIAFCIGLMLFATALPMAIYSGRILLHIAPGPLLGQLDKALREAATIDGVLEVKKRHFWSVGFGQVAGSVHVRVRRDANEQLVLAHITNRLESLVQRITVQILKDGWTRPAETQPFQWPPTLSQNIPGNSPLMHPNPPTHATNNLPDLISVARAKTTSTPML